MTGSKQKNGEPYDWNRAQSVARLMHAGVTFQDETLRDGIQNPSVVDPKIEDKLELIRLMARLGIQVAEHGTE